MTLRIFTQDTLEQTTRLTVRNVLPRYRNPRVACHRRQVRHLSVSYDDPGGTIKIEGNGFRTVHKRSQSDGVSVSSRQAWSRHVG